jgi:hypothetical protein
MVAEKYQDYVHNLIRRVLDEIGPRPSCSEAESRLGRLLAREWMPVCDAVTMESFMCSPRAFLGVLPLSVLAYFAAVILYWLYPPASPALAAVSFSLVFFELLRYREFVDFLFPRKKGWNVTGVIRPRGEARQRVIVSAHQDSAYEFRLWYHLGTASVWLTALSGAAIVFILAGGIARTLAWFGGSEEAVAYTAVGIAAIALSPVVGLFLFFKSGRAVPGAMDDMAGVAVVSGLARYLDDARHDGSFFPRSTEVVLLATSAEEAGLRGAKRYAEKHMTEMRQKPTYALFLDGIYDERLLTVTDSELFTGARHDAGLVRLAQEAAAARGWPIRKRWIPLGGTDASAFSLRGIPAVCLHCQDTSRLVFNYHTPHDTLENIRPRSLSVSLQMVIDMIERLDAGRAESRG